MASSSSSPTSSSVPPPSFISTTAVPSTRTAATSASDTRRRESHSYRTNTVWLNIYNITHLNDVMLPLLGIGVFHSSIEVYGTEFGFGRNGTGPGIFAIEPHSFPQHVFSESICIGSTRLSEAEVWAIHQRHHRVWSGQSYRILDRNCNDYSYMLGQLLVSAPSAAVANTWMDEMEKRQKELERSKDPKAPLPPQSAQGGPIGFSATDVTYGGRVALATAISRVGCCGAVEDTVVSRVLTEYDAVFPAWLNRICRVANAILPRSVLLAIENGDRAHAGMSPLEEL